MGIDLALFREAVEKTYFLRKLIGIFPLIDNKENPIKSFEEKRMKEKGFTYYQIHPFTKKMQYLIITKERKEFYPQLFDAEISAFEVWEVERKDQSTIFGEFDGPEYTVIPV